ncbi:MAG: hypothetical protein JWO38_8198 [Gemmataceae bacterium]|nr:hypothetical protein [Gemmataceae bacterium]
MRHLAALLALSAVANSSPSAEPDARTAADRGLKFLAEEAVGWKEDRKCASGHHAPMGLWALNEAKARGFKVDDKAVSNLTGWVLAKDDPAKVNPRQPPRPEVTVNQTPLMLALGIEAGGVAGDTRDGLKALLGLVLAGQDKDGAWRLLYVWEPFGSAPDVMTTLVLLALTDPNAPDLGAEGQAARERGLKWLEAAKPSDTPQADALRLLLWTRLGRPAKEREAIATRLAGRQNADGGWGQEEGAASDAYATGQALYALAAKGTKADDPAVRKAVAFLVKAQEKDGSWAMASRPGGPGGKAARNVAPITFAGTAWAVLGLVRCSPTDGAKPEK